jgi:hypothetical protein
LSERPRTLVNEATQKVSPAPTSALRLRRQTEMYNVITRVTMTARRNRNGGPDGMRRTCDAMAGLEMEQPGWEP